MNKDHVEIWNSCLSVIKDNVTEQGYKTWFEPIVPLSLTDNVLTLQVPTQFFYEYLEVHYIDLLKTVIKRFVGAKGKLEYRIPVDSANTFGSITLPSSNRNFPKNPIGQPAPQRLSEGPINPFVIPGDRQRAWQDRLQPLGHLQRHWLGQDPPLPRHRFGNQALAS